MNFDSLYRKHYLELHSFAYRLTSSKLESEDLVHESFCKLLSECQNNSDIQQPRAWLYKVVLNLVRSKFSTEKLHTEKLQQLEHTDISPDDIHKAYVLEEKQKIIANELKLLPDKERDILLLYQRGLTYNEIAQVLEMNVSSVGTTLARAIEKFSDTLKKKHHELFE